MEDPPKNFFRLGPGGIVRLKGAYIIRCDDFVRDPLSGEVTEVHCSYYPDSRSGADTSGIKVKGTIHWVSIPHAEEAEVRLYDRLFKDPEPTNHEEDFMTFFNEDSLQVIEKAYVEPGLKNVTTDDHFQFIRKGYFCLDRDSTGEKLVFNRTITLKDTWAKVQSK